MLADLEHCDTRRLLAAYDRKGPDSLQGYLSECWYLTALPQILHPFRDSEPTVSLFSVYDPERDTCVFMEKDDRGVPVEREGIYRIEREAVGDNVKLNLWLQRDYRELLETHAENQDSTPQKISLKYGELSFVDRENKKYVYSDQFGLVYKE